MNSRSSSKRLIWAAALSVAFLVPSVPALADCNSLQARCAVKIGGRCDPATGKWFYGAYGNQRAGGTAQAFNECVSRGGK